MSSAAYMPEEMYDYPVDQPAVDPSIEPYRRLAVAVLSSAVKERDALTKVTTFPNRAPREPVQGKKEQSFDYERRRATWSTRMTFWNRTHRKRIDTWVLKETSRAERLRAANVYLDDRDSLWFDLVATA